MIEFYTNQNKYLVTDKYIFQDGEIIAAGEVSIQHLLLDDDALFIVNKGHHQPNYLRIDKVISILPTDEYFDGERDPRRKIFHVSFEYFLQNKWICCNCEILAVNEFHVKHLLKKPFGNEIRSICLTEQDIKAS